MVSTGSRWRDTKAPPMPDVVLDARMKRDREVSGGRTSIRQIVDISTAVFSGLGLTIIVDHFGGDTLCLRLGPDLVGEFDRIDVTSPAFALRRLKPSAEDGLSQPICGKSVLWRRADLLDADAAVLALVRS